MDKLDKHIDDLFRNKLSEAKLPGIAPETGWLKLRKTIRRRNFMRFAPGTFNIYYMVAAIGLTAFVGSYFIKDNHSNKERTSPNNSVTVIDSIHETISTPAIDSSSIVKPVIEKTAKISEKKVIKRCVDDMKKDTIKPQPDSTITPISEPCTIAKDSTTATRSAPDSIKPIVSPMASDTIVTIDTIRVKKKSVKFKRKKTSL
jgi:hypothetical protein